MTLPFSSVNLAPIAIVRGVLTLIIAILIVTYLYQ